MTKKTFIIAEAGANHNMSFKQALALIDAAAEAGADACKFQTYSSNTLYSKNTPDFAGYENISKLIEDIQMPREWQKDLKAYCDEVGIEFMSTPFDEQAVEELVEIGVKRLKVSGFESTDPRFVRMVASTQLPLIISVGIGSNLYSIGGIIECVAKEYLPQVRPDITILHCNNAYPTPDEDINLNRIDKILQKYGGICHHRVKVGLSDHTRGILAPPLAVSKGATCIEKHFTLSRRLPGPDHPFAIEPHELKIMVENIRKAEVMCADTEEKLTNSEKAFSKAMRSVVTSMKINKGDVLIEKNLTTKRPCLEDSISAKDYYTVLGSHANCDIEEDVILTLEMFDAKG